MLTTPFSGVPVLFVFVDGSSIDQKQNLTILELEIYACVYIICVHVYIYIYIYIYIYTFILNKSVESTPNSTKACC